MKKYLFCFFIVINCMVGFASIGKAEDQSDASRLDTEKIYSKLDSLEKGQEEIKDRLDKIEKALEILRIRISRA